MSVIDDPQDAARALLAGPWQRHAMLLRLTYAAGAMAPDRWVRSIVDAALAIPPAELGAATVDSLAAALSATREWSYRGCDLDRPALQRLLGLDDADLDWFARAARTQRREVREPLRHYRYQWIARRGGGRLIEAPKPRLKEIQRRVLRHVLAPIPLHRAAHGGVPSHSARTAALVHVQPDVVIRLDLATFFSSITAARCAAALRASDVAPSVAELVAQLCTSIVPMDVWAQAPRPAADWLGGDRLGGDRLDGDGLDRRWELGAMLRSPHLPQGAPTSPALANIVATRLDRRIDALAQSLGARYTRYVDDLHLSGPASFRRAAPTAVRAVREIVASEGWAINESKTIVDGRSGRHALLGVVINDHPAAPREQIDELRAILHNCASRGWRSQVRGRSPETYRAHLLGRVSQVGSTDPRRGALLRAAYDRIDWS
jgi:RNA-directed DNA polymerase